MSSALADVGRAAVTGDPILAVSGISVEYATKQGNVRAVDDVSFDLGRGEFIGIVGESGCGKSTLLFAIAQLLSPPAGVAAGSVVFKGTSMVGIDPEHLRSYPHQLSGGMRQRAMIAMALLFTPDLVIMDEPTSALDVVAQRSLMVQIKELQAELGFSIIFVTHDMSLVRHFSDRLMVMYAGQVAELGATSRVFGAPLHPYTIGLMDAFPSIKGARVPLTGIPGQPPDLARKPEGCLFAPRCPKVMTACETVRPPLYLVEGTEVRCLLFADGSTP